MALGITNHIKVFVIRNAGGIASLGSFTQPQKPFSATYNNLSPRISLSSKSAPGSNSQLLLDPSRVTKVVHALGEAGISRENFTAFRHSNLSQSIDLTDSVIQGDEIWFIANTLLGLNRALLRTVLSNILPDKNGIGR